MWKTNSTWILKDYTRLYQWRSSRALMFLIEHNKMKKLQALFALFLWHAVKNEGKSMGNLIDYLGQQRFLLIVRAHKKFCSDIWKPILLRIIVRKASRTAAEEEESEIDSREISIEKEEKMKANICLFNLSTNFYSAPSLPDTGYRANRKVLQWWREGKEHFNFFKCLSHMNGEDISLFLFISKSLI